MEGEDNLRNTPEPQITDGCGEEGEDSVSSVILELITEVYASRRFKMSELVHFKSKEIDLKEMGAITNLCPLKASKVRIQDPFGAEFMTQGLPCNFGEARILMVLDPLNGSRPFRCVFCTMGASNSPHGLQTADGEPRTVGPQNIKMAKYGHISKKDH
ncbi:hypothetical protein O181_107383 [Austropuccinia psidii MF-1]|uniref:Uncharacterized protein n=1 Tax=Austropuccinia psidii MF-1 TaxID=1389203 RepID=A0A9Q3JQR8_9BASI|nr:hypothetical protein [Austropuccinia psidii MF-1]